MESFRQVYYDRTKDLKLEIGERMLRWYKEENKSKEIIKNMLE